MKGHGAKLPRKQEAAIAALMSNGTIELAARSIQVSSKSLRRWMRLPEFHEEYMRTRREAVMQAFARLQHNAGAASSVLLKCVADPPPNAVARIRASQSVLELSMKAVEKEDFAIRLARLEARSKKESPA